MRTAVALFDSQLPVSFVVTSNGMMGMPTGVSGTVPIVSYSKSNHIRESDVVADVSSS